ncbi:MAG TPA: MATE family efflux transporter, partial [Spirochaetales bacterium]|nr:MATE family efflux transporter [Spirochaetales bacterium]
MARNRIPLLGPWSFYRTALGVAVPVMLQQAVMSLVSLVDNFMVAGLGDARMAAVNVANQVNFVYFVVLFTLCGAGGIYLSQFKGSGDEEGMRQAYRFKLAASLAVSGIWLFLTLAIPERMVALMLGGNPQGPEIIREAAGYLRIVSIAWIPMAVSTSIATGLREIGRARPPLYISVAATLVNTFFN